MCVGGKTKRKIKQHQQQHYVQRWSNEKKAQNTTNGNVYPHGKLPKCSVVLRRRSRRNSPIPDTLATEVSHLDTKKEEKRRKAQHRRTAREYCKTIMAALLLVCYYFPYKNIALLSLLGWRERRQHARSNTIKNTSAIQRSSYATPSKKKRKRVFLWYFIYINASVFIFPFFFSPFKHSHSLSPLAA